MRKNFKKEANLSHEYLLSQLHYDENTGIFIRKVSNHHSVSIGDVAGCEKPDGYITIWLNDAYFYASRLAWFYVTKKWPEYEIDHINTIRSDNAFENLRDIKPKHNCQNKITSRKDNSLKTIPGVGYRKDNGKYRVRLTINGKLTTIGTYSTIEEAENVCLAARREFYTGNTL